jgi:hypothetical protein
MRAEAELEVQYYVYPDTRLSTLQPQCRPRLNIHSEATAQGQLQQATSSIVHGVS